MTRVLVWFSCGAASAVAAKVCVDAYGDRAEGLYCDTLASEHPDNARFMADVERWIGKPIKRLRSDRYTDVDDVFQRTRYMASRYGARCTTELKKLPRENYQAPGDVHVFGYTADEQRRADAFEERNPSLSVEWPLIERGISKADCFGILAAARIELPVMYSLGFAHNNCVGCVKSQSPGYWNRVRRHFPETFARRAEQSRAIGCRLAVVRGQRVYLDELDPSLGGADDDIECGPVCQVPLDFGATREERTDGRP